MQSDGRECTRADQCLTSWTDSSGTRRGAWGPRALCVPCRSSLIDTLAEVPELYAWLWLMLPTSHARPAGRVTGGGGPAPMPIRADVDAIMRQIYDVMASWEERVRTVARISDRSRAAHPQARALTEITRTLECHIDVLLALDHGPMVRRWDPEAPPPQHGRLLAEHHAHGHVVATVAMDGADAAGELFALARRARGRAGQTRQVSALPGVPCPQCSLLALVRVAGEDSIQCRGCGAQLAPEDYDRWVGEAAAALPRGA